MVDERRVRSLEDVVHRLAEMARCRNLLVLGYADRRTVG